MSKYTFSILYVLILPYLVITREPASAAMASLDILFISYSKFLDRNTLEQTSIWRVRLLFLRGQSVNLKPRNTLSPIFSHLTSLGLKYFPYESSVYPFYLRTPLILLLKIWRTNFIPSGVFINSEISSNLVLLTKT